MQIQELERRVQMDRASIRFYESEGLISPKRLPNGYRDYSDADVQMLLKIKFLRQLDISVANIRKLQAGEITLQKLLESMDTQQQALDAQAAQAVRQELIHDCTGFNSLDIPYYSRRFRSAKESVFEEPVIAKPAETVNFPVRRLLAKTLDRFFVLIIIQCFLLAVVRLRPIDHWLYVVSILLTPWITVVTEAFSIWLNGTTLGKYLFGIHLQHREHKRYSLSQAFERTMGAFHYGEGLGIPVYGQIRMCVTAYYIFKHYDLPWDYDTKRTVFVGNWKRTAVWIVCIVISVFLLKLRVNEQFLPRYIEKNPTISQFLENMECYRKGAKVVNTEGEEVLPNGVAEFTYTLSGQKITAVHYRNTTTAVFLRQTIPSRCESAAYALVGGQPGMTKAKLEQFAAMYQEYLTKDTMKSKGSLAYEGVTVQWDIQKDGVYYNVSFDILLPD